MQQLVTDLPVRELQPYECSSGKFYLELGGLYRFSEWKGYPDTRINMCIPDLDTLANNTICCKNNFTRIDATTAKLETSITGVNRVIEEQKTEIKTINPKITELNSKLDELKRNYDELKTQHETLMRQLTVTDTNVGTIKQEMKTLSANIGKVLAFVPNFVRNASRWFVSLLTGVKTNNLEAIEEFHCDSTELSMV